MGRALLTLKAAFLLIGEDRYLRGSVEALKMACFTLDRTMYPLCRKFPIARVGAALLLAFSIMLRAQQGTPTTSVIVQPGSPGSPSKTLPSDTHATVSTASQADIDFMQGMIMHHTQAVEMTALIASHTGSANIRSLGAKISSSQSDEIRFMQRWLVARAQATSMSMPGMPDMDMDGKPMAPMPGMLTPAQMVALRAARGSEFDHLFLTGMIQHHNGALIMVKDLFNTAGAGQDADLFNFATDADNTQRAEIRIMQSMLQKEASPKEGQ
jgi:uncharacterized protein (DUF305 family)